MFLKNSCVSNQAVQGQPQNALHIRSSEKFVFQKRGVSKMSEIQSCYQLLRADDIHVSCISVIQQLVWNSS